MTWKSEVGTLYPKYGGPLREKIPGFHLVRMAGVRVGPALRMLLTRSDASNRSVVLPRHNLNTLYVYWYSKVQPSSDLSSSNIDSTDT